MRMPALSTGTVFLVLVLMLSGCVTEKPEKPVHAMNFHGLELHFRGDLNKAKHVPVFPDERSLVKMLLGKEVKRVTIAFPNVSSGAGYYAVAGFELAFKLTVIYNSIYSPFHPPETEEKNGYTCLFYPDYQKEICIGKKIFADESELKAGRGEVIIALFAGELAHSTEIYAESSKSVIYVYGKDLSQQNRSYTDLDLAADKLLLMLFSHLQ